jgi:hypothetical protein
MVTVTVTVTVMVTVTVTVTVMVTVTVWYFSDLKNRGIPIPSSYLQRLRGAWL